jgi:hypothetical protein
MLKMSSAFVTAVILATTVPAPLSAAPRAVHVGVLNCNSGPSIGLLIGSQQRLNCVFVARSGAKETYAGTVSRLGLDVGVTAGGRLVWRVYAPSSSFKGHALAGNYVGGSANASLVVGGGANLLVGGSDRTITLQPLSVEGRVGANLAVGVASMDLQ